MSKKIVAPWTVQEVAALNRWQNYGFVHEFTCANEHDDRRLLATVGGWVCPNCDYTQDWANDFMLNAQTDPLKDLKK